MSGSGSLAPPSPLLVGHLRELEKASGLGPVLDLACGRGRHALELARRGIPCIGVDRNAASLAALRERSAPLVRAVDPVRADVETGRGIPFTAGSCGAILVFRFLSRPLAPAIEQCLAPGGVLLYETFTIEQLGFDYGPRTRSFLLERGELPELFPSLEVLDYWEGLSEGERPEALARLAARRPVRA